MMLFPKHMADGKLSSSATPPKMRPAWKNALNALLIANTHGDEASGGSEGATQASSGSEGATHAAQEAMLKLGISMGNGLKSDGSRGAPEVESEAEMHWQALHTLLEHNHYKTSAHGAAAGHSHDAREAAARKLITNHKAVLYDITNPAPRTQHVLQRLEESVRPYVDEALREVARRLLGDRRGSKLLEVRCDLSNADQGTAWAAAWLYLDGRIQASPNEKPGRTPDLSADAAAAMRAVMQEVAHMPLAATTAASAPHWAMMHRMLDSGELESTADGVASAHAHSARDAAARKLIGNHANVLKDIVNPSPTMNIEGKPLTQLSLTRVSIGLSWHVDCYLREVARRLLGRRPGSEQLEMRRDLSNADQRAAWAGACAYLDGRIQASPDEKPGRTPDLSVDAAAAMQAVMFDVTSSFEWDLLRGACQRVASKQSANKEASADLEIASLVIGKHADIVKLWRNTPQLRSTVISQGNGGGILMPTHLNSAPMLHTVHSQRSEIFMEQALREIARRVLVSAGEHLDSEESQPHTQEQLMGWETTAMNLETFYTRKSHNDAQFINGMHLSPTAVDRLQPLLDEMKLTVSAVAARNTEMQWDVRLEVFNCADSSPSETHVARETAAGAILANHEWILHNVPESSEFVPLSPVADMIAIDGALLEVTRQLLRHKAGMQLDMHKPVESRGEAVWSHAVRAIDHSMLDSLLHPEQIGRTASILAKAAMRSALYELVGQTLTSQTPPPTALRRSDMMDSPEQASRRDSNRGFTRAGAPLQPLKKVPGRLRADDL